MDCLSASWLGGGAVWLDPAARGRYAKTDDVNRIVLTFYVDVKITFLSYHALAGRSCSELVLSE